jgi:hypothetical protein
MFEGRVYQQGNIDQHGSMRISATAEMLLSEEGKAAKVLQERPKISDFSGIYGSEELKRNAQFVEKRKLDSSENSLSSQIRTQKQYANIMEATMAWHGEMNEWFGPESHVVLASEYDDIANKVDVVVSLPGKSGSGRRHIAIDVTFSKENVTNKIADARRLAAEGKRVLVKYYACEETDEKGGILAPRVIVGMGREKIEELASLWQQGKNAALGNHEVQIMILGEVLGQLRFFAREAAVGGYEAYVSELNEIIDVMSAIRREKIEKAKTQPMTSFQNSSDEIRGLMNDAIKDQPSAARVVSRPKTVSDSQYA